MLTNLEVSLILVFYMHVSHRIQVGEVAQAESTRWLLTDNPKRQTTSLPPELVLTNRLPWGLNSLLVALDAEADWSAILYPLIGRA